MIYFKKQYNCLIKKKSHIKPNVNLQINILNSKLFINKFFKKLLFKYRYIFVS